MKLVADLPPNAVYLSKDGPLTLTVGRKDSTLIVKAETDSLIPTVREETAETFSWAAQRSEREEKPPDKPSFWERIKGELWHLAVGLVLCLAAWKLFVGYVRRE